VKTPFRLLLISGAALLALSGCAADKPTDKSASASAAPAVHHSLEGGPWKVVGFDDGSTVPANVTAEITFEPGDHNTSKVFGNGGCNRFNGSFSEQDRALRIGPLASTRMACAEPAGRMAQEAQFLAALESAAKAQREGDMLELRTASGALAVSARLATPAKP